MKGRRLRIEKRWKNFMKSGFWDTEMGDYPGLPDPYLLYLEHLLLVYPPSLVKKIMGDLVCKHLFLYGENPLSDVLVKCLMDRIYALAKEEIKCCWMIYTGRL